MKTPTANTVFIPKHQPANHAEQPAYKQRAFIAYVCLNQFYPLDYIPAENLAIYKLLHWSGEYFAAAISAHRGKILRDSILWQPIYQGCTPKEAAESAQLKLSFRAPADPRICQPYVLVRILHPAKEPPVKLRYPILKGES